MRVLPSTTPSALAPAAPTFAPGVVVGQGFLGEPTLLSDAQGRLLLTFPGCDGSHSQGCANAPIYRSLDGQEWTSLNTAEDGKLDKKGPAANGDAMLALGADGALYASNLGQGLPHWRSTDDGATWKSVGNPVPDSQSADRQWGWAGPAGLVVSAWMATSPTRSAAVAVSHDAGKTWGAPFEADATIGWIGPIAASPDGRDIFVPYTKPLNVDPAGVTDPSGFLVVGDPQTELRLLRSTDGGATWSVQGTGHVILKNPASAQWPGTLMAPILARTGSGTLVYVWSEQRLDASARAAGTEASVYAMRSRDNGTTWSQPQLLSAARTAIMPWVVAGAGERFAVSWYGASDVVVDHDYEGTWDVDAAILDGDAVALGTVASGVHKGGICAKGGVCGAMASDRSMLDFMGGALLPDGRFAVAYCASPSDSTSGLLGGSNTKVMVAVQSSPGNLL